jgi:ketosteroid isomerase-like protein
VSYATTDLRPLARAAYDAFASGDRAGLEALLADDLRFSSGPDPLLDREGFFERCWPGHEHVASFTLHRLVQSGDEVIVTYEAARSDGTRFRNTEVLTFRDELIVRQEVYFGWDLPPAG